MSTRAHIGQVLKIEIWQQFLYTLSHICGSNHFPIYRAPTPLTKDVSGEYPFPILLSLPFCFLLPPLSFGCLLLLPLPVSVIVGTFGCTHWSILISHLCLLPLFSLPALYSYLCHTFVYSGGQSWRTGLVIRSR